VLVVLASKGGIDVDDTRRVYPRVGEVPFDSEYKFMGTFHEMQDSHGNVVRCFVKGAPDVILGRSSKIRDAEGNDLDVDEYRDRVIADADRGRRRARGWLRRRRPVWPRLAFSSVGSLQPEELAGERSGVGAELRERGKKV
jgi:magnesium-transporting ATPase (P-type)